MRLQIAAGPTAYKNAVRTRSEEIKDNSLIEWRPQGDYSHPSDAHPSRGPLGDSVASAFSRPAPPASDRTRGSASPLLETRFNKKARARRAFLLNGVPKGIRTPVTAVKGRCPRPLDDGDATNQILVELGGIEPPTSCMPCKRSPS